MRTLKFFTAIICMVLTTGWANASWNNPVLEMLRLQTVGSLATMTFTEPCTSDGLRDAVQRNDDAVANRDFVTMANEQRAYAAGFARCALHSISDVHAFTMFTAACVQSGTDAIVADAGLGALSAMDEAKMRQMTTLAKWLLHNNAVSATDRQIARNALHLLSKLHSVAAERL